MVKNKKNIKLKSKTLTTEELTRRDLIRLRDYIRAEVALILKDLWLKKSIWM